jgi:hypothetical protein
MKNLISILATGVIALALGAAAGWYFASGKEPAPANMTAATPRTNAPLDAPPLKTEDGGETADADTPRLLSEARSRVDDLEQEISTLKAAKTGLETEKETLQGQVEQLKTELEQAKQAAEKANEVTPEETGGMPVVFGKWNEVEGLRDADWKSLGDTYTKMLEMLKVLAADARQGKEPDAETSAKIGELNKGLIQHLVKFYGKLPTNAPGNGEFTHPANMVNILAGQLEAGNMPLTEQQVADLQRLGNEYDTRWEALQKGYTKETWPLQKIVDEAELKEWFHDEMFKVTTPQQKAFALPAEIEGYMRLDLYSAGLVLMLVTKPVHVNDAAELKPTLKAQVAARLGVEVAALDGADYIFDDWVNSLGAQLAPQTANDAALMRTRDAIVAGKAELAAMRALHDQFIADEAVRKKFAGITEIALPQVIKQE